MKNAPQSFYFICFVLFCLLVCLFVGFFVVVFVVVVFRGGGSWFKQNLFHI